jgi:hypothetical protein
MEFCSFVPEAARSYILEIINGEPPRWNGLQRLADKAKERLDQLLQKNQDKVGQGNLLSTVEVEEQSRTKAHYKQLLGDLEAVQRLGTDYQMEPVYKALHKKFNEDEPLRRFLHATWNARIDFLRHKEALERGTVLSKEIAEEAESLGIKIRELTRTFHDTPLELHSISELLRQTDNNELNGHNHGMWRIHRGVILGDPTIEPHTPSPTDEAKGEKPSHPTLEELFRRDLRYAWGLAPNFPELLLKIAEIMGNFTPLKHGFVGAGVSSREANEKTAYIRGLHKLLKDEHGFKIDLPIKQAMAAVTLVMLNNPDIHVTTDDVTKAIRHNEKKGGG